MVAPKLGHRPGIAIRVTTRICSRLSSFRISRSPTLVRCEAKEQRQHVAPPSSSEGSDVSDVELVPRSNNSNKPRRRRNNNRNNKNGRRAADIAPLQFNPSAPIYLAKPLPKVLLIHTGGTLGMDPDNSFEVDVLGHRVLKAGTGGMYRKQLRPGNLLSNLIDGVPELSTLAQIDLQVVFNMDSSNVGPKEWILLAKSLHKYRDNYDAFIVIHGTDTMAWTASALSLMLAGFRKPIILTGSQIPLALPRSDAKQNLLDSLTCAVAAFNPPHVALQEVAICFGGKLLRGNRAQKWNSSIYQAFDSPGYPPLAQLGVDIDWNRQALHQPAGVYRPRFELDSRVIRIPIVPGCDPRLAYGNLYERGIRGVVLEAFGVGNMPDYEREGWMPWLRSEIKAGTQFYLRSQSSVGPLAPELYKSGTAALKLGVEAGPQMTAEAACVKLMLCLHYRDLPVAMPLAGEL